ncbi:MAG TPA: hypothetical protein VJ746_18770 [Nitrospira sp.]|nr:hypothetical protein [Nitrospira sp.]
MNQAVGFRGILHPARHADGMWSCLPMWNNQRSRAVSELPLDLIAKLSLLLIAVSMFGCTSSRPVTVHEAMTAEDFEGRCALSAKPSPGPRTSGVIPPSSSLPASLSAVSRTIAEIVGVVDLLVAIAELEQRATQEPRRLVDLVAARQYLLIAIQSALSEVQSAAAEVRCEKERADQTADRLQENLSREVRALTLSAILAGAIFGFASGGLFLAGVSTAGTAVSISGGVVETVLASIGLSVDRSQVLRHRRNVLREVWQGRGPEPVLPEIVWRFLNQPLTEDLLHRSLRETMALRWRDDGRLGTPGSEQERRLALFFGEGGRYDIADLRARAAMLNLLEADIQLMTQDLNLFIEEQLVRQPPSLPGP